MSQLLMLFRLQDKPGRPASVDYAINLEGGNQLLKCIPVETKRMFAAIHLKQLSSYVNKLSTYEKFKNDVIVGLLLTQYQFQFAFLLFKFKDREDKTVPLVYISPPFEWRNDHCVNSEGLLLLSVVHLIKLKRLVYDVDDIDDVLLKVSDKLHECPFQAATLTSKFVASDTAYERLFFYSAAARGNKKIEQLGQNDRLIQEQQELIRMKQDELERTDKFIQETLSEHKETLEHLMSQHIDNEYNLDHHCHTTTPFSNAQNTSTIVCGRWPCDSSSPRPIYRGFGTCTCSGY